MENGEKMRDREILLNCVGNFGLAVHCVKLYAI